jgi:hypothetical protein
MKKPTPSERRRAELRAVVRPESWLRAAVAPSGPTAAERRLAALRLRRQALKAEPGWNERQREIARARALEKKVQSVAIEAVFGGACRECDAPIAKGACCVWLKGVGVFCPGGCERGWAYQPSEEGAPQ